MNGNLLPGDNRNTMTTSTGSQLSDTDRDIRIREISSLSFALMFALMCSIFGFCSGFLRSYDLLRAYSDADQQPPLTASFVIKDMLIAGALGLVGWFVIGFLIGGFVAGLYNMTAKSTGGLRIRIRDA